MRMFYLQVQLKPHSDTLTRGNGSAHVRCRLNRGDRVRVCHAQGDLTFKGQCHTTFSGVLEHVYVDDCPL